MAHHPDDRTVVTINDPGDLFAALPYMFGFRPSESVVLLARDGPRHRIGRKLRADLPDDGSVERELVGQLSEAITVDEPSSVLILVVSEASAVRPHATLIQRLGRAIVGRGVASVEAYWTPQIAAGAAWFAYDDSACCGVVPDPKSTVTAAEHACQGYVAYDSRQHLDDLLAPDDPARLAARAVLIDQRFADLAEESSAARQRAGVRAVRAGLRAAATGVLEPADEHLADLAVALSEPAVRDACLATAIPPGTDAAAHAEWLWQVLARALPAPERAEPAALAGFAAYMRGDGALAGIALARALAANPAHVLAGLLVRALDAGFAPQRLHGLVERDNRLLVSPDRAAS